MKINENVKKWLLMGGVVVVVIVGGFFAVKALFPGQEVDTGPKYTTAEIVRGDLEVGVEATGSLNAGYGGSFGVPLANDEKGNNVSYSIREVFVKNGDVVKAGSPIMKLAAPSLDTQVQSLVEQLAAERKALAAMLNIPIDKVDNATAESGITIVAPISGRLNLTVKPGGKIEQGQLVAKVINADQLEMTVPLTAYEISELQEGKTKALINTSTGMGATIEATITDINKNAVPVESKTLILDSGVPSEETGVEFIYEVILQVKNPGLLQPGRNVSVGFYIPSGDYKFVAGDIPPGTMWARYMAPIAKYVDEEDIFSTIEGVATKILKKNNSTVVKGDPIVSMAGQDVKDEIEKKLDSIRKKKADLNKFEAQQGSLTIVAPSDGIVDGFDKKKGGTVNSGDNVGHIFSSVNMNMNVQVDDTEVLMVQTGAPVRITLEAMPGIVFEGKVDYIGGYGGEGGITRYDVGISLTGSGELRPGMQAKAHVDSGSASDVLLAPMEAIFREDGIDKVEVLNPDGTVSVVAIEVGLMNARTAEVKSGLTEGQLVITGSTTDVLPSQDVGGNSLIPGVEGEGEDTAPPEGDGGAAPTINNDGGMDGGKTIAVPVGSVAEPFTLQAAKQGWVNSFLNQVWEQAGANSACA